jgi:hypothetical protein
MQQQAVAQFVAMTPAGFHGSQSAVPFIGVQGCFQAGRDIVLGIYGQNEGENDAISFLTGHEFHPVSTLRRRLTTPGWNA